MKKAVIYFVKFPEIGKVKTRLGVEIGFEQAALYYRSLCGLNFNTLRMVAAREVKMMVYYEPEEKRDEIMHWLKGADDYIPQKGNDLGIKLKRGFEAGFKSYGGPCIAIGSDTLGLRASIIRKGLDILKKTDVAIGPAKDGGYYALGLSKVQPQIFERIPWSTPDVMARTLAVIKKAGLSHALMPELSDLDTLKDLNEYNERGLTHDGNL